MGSVPTRHKVFARIKVLRAISWHFVVTGEDSWDYDQLVYEFRSNSKCLKVKACLAL